MLEAPQLERYSKYWDPVLTARKTTAHHNATCLSASHKTSPLCNWNNRKSLAGTTISVKLCRFVQTPSCSTMMSFVRNEITPGQFPSLHITKFLSPEGLCLSLCYIPSADAQLSRVPQTHTGRCSSELIPSVKSELIWSHDLIHVAEVDFGVECQQSVPPACPA